MTSCKWTPKVSFKKQKKCLSNWSSWAVKNNWSWRLEHLDKNIYGQIYGSKPTNGNQSNAQIWSKKSANARNLKTGMGIWLHNFYFKILSQSKRSYQLLMKFMLIKSQLSSEIFPGKYRTFQQTFWTIWVTWTSFLLVDPKFI